MGRLPALATLVVAGDTDYTPVSAKEAYLKLLLNARLVVIPDGRHMMTVEHPDAFNGIVLDFLDGLSASTPSLRPPDPRPEPAR